MTACQCGDAAAASHHLSERWSGLTADTTEEGPPPSAEEGPPPSAPYTSPCWGTILDFTSISYTVTVQFRGGLVTFFFHFL